jgi:hypothetical protein
MVCPVCNSRSSVKSGVEFPTGGERFQQWILALNIAMTEEELKGKGRHHFFVCFEHFNRNDWILEGSKLVGVQKGAIPGQTASISRLRCEKLVRGDVFPEFLLVERSNLEELFRFCYDCGHPVDLMHEHN